MTREQIEAALEEQLNEAFDKNEADYWEAHAEFGSDPDLRDKWFFSVGRDSLSPMLIEALEHLKWYSEFEEGEREFVPGQRARAFLQKFRKEVGG